MTLAEFNQAETDSARELLANCCVSRAWIQTMLACRPFVNVDDLLVKAAEIWLQLEASDYLEAFTGHPQIGDLASLQARYAQTQALAAAEQSAVQSAGPEVLQALAAANAEYLDRFGYIFIVCAQGKSALEMLTLLRARLLHSSEDELRLAAAEQSKITRLRLLQALASARSAPGQITTHVLDTARGVPAQGILLHLLQHREQAWHPLALGITNTDGRVMDLLLPEQRLPAGRYRMRFELSPYWQAQQQRTFYPQVEIEFCVEESGAHYHIPLLLSPFGYSTYRGS
ncbi:2-oxo-4-hydroxy-4-carboxy-5-ureidoimidazoline decarboxylase [Nitrincola tapanii]|uniref:5-hydroxyisourate hydrolase n=1 Tax=Nitrincola tapanii TaxID=1708751 RepID=A0A5A9W4E2_9GAMM|nr:2-oxo-4-hydroxy-4-carboxy-5-ureidoimidazoline decarboxylase [Nitrincola tapanii]KAA0874411.1 2-oxo-4-hydroxy-4-carboxy-5-ureidoimidazoline decarboxylase [Nitrincola tapanii]